MLFLLIILGSLAIACGSPAAKNISSNAPANRTNVSASNADLDADAYSRSENAYTTASNGPLGSLTPSGKSARELVGKTMTEARLWEHKDVGPPLRKLMGADYATMRKFWNVETPIKKFGDFLMMSGCEQHNCGDNQYVIFMNMGDGRIKVVRIGRAGSREWSDGDFHLLPPPFAEELSEMKSGQ